MGIIAWIVFGFIIGLLARAIVPGRQPMGWLATAVLGMVGSLVGGLIGHALFGSNNADNGLGFTPGGLISSIVGAIIVLWIYLGFSQRRRTV